MRTGFLAINLPLFLFFVVDSENIPHNLVWDFLRVGLSFYKFIHKSFRASMIFEDVVDDTPAPGP